MTLYRISVAIFLVALSLTGCGSESSAPPDDGDPSDPIAKSPKRGIAYNLSDASDLAALADGVSWWYNWHHATSAPDGWSDDYQMTFIPMLWGWNPQQDYARVKDFILDHPEIEYLLVLNEPNLTDQANMVPADAAAEWVKYEQLLDELAAQGRDIALVGPAMTWGTLSGYSDPVTWLDAFYDAYRLVNGGRDPRIDYLAFHWYDYGLEAQLDRLEKYGKQIWITEMANWNPNIRSYADQADQMREMVALCESRDDVFRYAWFIGRGDLPDNHYTYLFNPTPGELSDLGQLYISLPYAQ